MTEAEKLLQETKSAVVAETQTEDICVIDSDLRIASIPEQFKILGVEHDKDVRVIQFKLPKMYKDLDLSAFTISVNFLNAKNEKGRYLVTDKSVSGDQICFSWSVGNIAVRYKGNTRFIVCMRLTGSDGEIQKEFNTTLATMTVLEGLEVDNPVIEQGEKDIVAQLLQIVDEKSKEAVNAVKNAGTAQKTAVEGAGTQAVENVENAQQAATEAVGEAKTAAVQAVQAEGGKQIKAVQTAAQDIIADRELIHDLKGDLVELSELGGAVAEREIVNIPIAWIQTDEYYNDKDSVTTSQYYYQFELLVETGDKFTIDGTTDGTKCTYVTLDASNNVIQKYFVNTEYNVLHTGLEVVIGETEKKLIVQAKSIDRAKFSIKKDGGYKVKDGVVSVSALDDEVKGFLPSAETVKNLFNKNDSDIVVGKYLTGNSMIDNERFNVSGFIPVENGKTYSFPAYPNFFGESKSARVYCFKSDKTYYSFIVGTLNGKLNTVTINNMNVAFVRFNYANGATATDIKSIIQVPDNVMFTESPYPTRRYYPYGAEYVLADNVRVYPSIESTLNPLFGKSAVFTGDSICNASSAKDGLGGWAGRIGRKNRMLWKNSGISGATITSKTVTSSTGTISETDFEDADYIIIEGGTNDADLIGDARTTKPQNFGAYVMNDFTTEFVNTTYCGAIESLFKRVTTENKGKKVGVIIAQKMGKLNASNADYTKEHNNRRFYFDTLISLCEKWGIPYLNLWDCCHLNPMNPSHYADGQNLMYTDGQHLSTEGYDYISPIIEAWMKTL